MADFGLTPEGLKIKRLADVLADAAEALKQVEDPVTGERLQPDFSAADPAMQVVKIPLEAVGDLWALLHNLYSQFDPDAATGAALSGVVRLNGIERAAGMPSVVQLQLTGVAHTLIRKGQRVSDAQRQLVWLTQADVTLDASGLASVVAWTEEKGAFTAAPGQLSVILTPVVGWNTVTNAASAVHGVIEEPDSVLRQRRDQSTMAPASSPVEAIYANLRNVPGVDFVRVLVNNTLVMDERGIPPKAIAAVVVGGADEDVARVLLERSPALTQWHGNALFVVTDNLGDTYPVQWVRPNEVPIYVEADIQSLGDGQLTDDYAARIADAVVTYTRFGAPGLGIPAAGGYDQDGIVPGEDVVAPRLYTPINSVPGHALRALRIGTFANPPDGADIPINWDAWASFDASRITINLL